MKRFFTKLCIILTVFLGGMGATWEKAAVVGVFGKKLYFLVSKPGRTALKKELKIINSIILFY